MDFEYQFVANGKIDFLYLAMVKMYGTKGGMTDFGMVKNAIIKGTVYKRDGYKGALGEITIGKNTVLKFLEIYFLHTISDVVVCDIKKVVCHDVFSAVQVSKFRLVRCCCVNLKLEFKT